MYKKIAFALFALILLFLFTNQVYAQCCDRDTKMSWSEGQNLRIWAVWNAPERAGGDYSASSWPQGELATDRAFLFAARLVLSKEWNISSVIATHHPGGGFAQLVEAETNYYKNHTDSPAHFHINFIWPDFSGHVNTHFWTNSDGTVRRAFVLYNVPGCPTGEKYPPAGSWWAEIDQNCNPVWLQSWTADGAVQLKQTANSPVYTLRGRSINGDLSGSDVYLGAQRIYSVDVTEYDATNLRMVVKISDYRNNKLITETYTGTVNPWAPLSNRSTVESSLQGQDAPTPTRTPTSTQQPTSTQAPTSTPLPTSTPVTASTQAPTSTRTVKPTRTTKPTQTPKLTQPPTATPLPSATLLPSSTPVLSATQLPASTPTTTPAATLPPPAPATACTRYVSVSGNDANPGTADRPWRTVAKAGSSALAGDTVCFRAGTWNERLRPANSGKAGAPITFTAFPGEEGKAVLDLRQTVYDASSRGYGIIHIDNKSFITVSNLRLVNSGYYGVFVRQSSNITILNNQLHTIYASGIIALNAVSDLVIDGNDLQRVTHRQGGTDQLHESISLLLGVENFEIKNNHIHNPFVNPDGTISTKEGIDVKQGVRNGRIYNNTVNLGRSTGIYVDAYDRYAENIEIYNNTSFNNGNGLVVAAEGGGTVNNIKIYNNVIYNNSSFGVRIVCWQSVFPDVTCPASGIEIVNNTVYGNSADGIEISNKYLTSALVRNNISLNNGRYNLFISSILNSIVTQDSNLTAGDARFVNAGAGDFHLTSNSPAIDAGSATGAPGFDRDSITRPQGSRVDIGAYERQAHTSQNGAPATQPFGGLGGSIAFLPLVVSRVDPER